MRRAIPTLAVTMLALGGLAAFKTTASGGASARGIAPSQTAPAAAAPPRTTPTTGPPSTTPAATAPPATTTPTTGRSSATTTYDGDPVDNRYGTVQVRITVQGKQVTAVDAIQMPYDHQRSQYISEQAGPYLQQEVLQAQSAQIDIVSGATVTSESYMQSLQSALDKAGI